jgi:hypothetical protein
MISQEQIENYLVQCLNLWEKEVKDKFKPGSDPQPLMVEKLSKVEAAFNVLYGKLDKVSRQAVLDAWHLEFIYEEADATLIGNEKTDWYEQHLQLNPKNKKNFPFWSRYKAYLKSKGRTLASLNKLDSATDEIISNLANPSIPNDSFEKRGLVVGYVQSGKTGNFTGLINKALDVGYDYIIVLGGLHDNLRSQTQRRVDEGVIGKKADGTLIGCGLVRDYQQSKVFLLEPHTTVVHDFSIKKAALLNPLSEVKHIFVVKKNAAILENLSEYFTKIINTYKHHGQRVNSEGKLRNTSLLIIDDESDQASIDTTNYSNKEREDTNPKAINMGIRKLLCKFEKNSYVGYTATPFANVFIDDQAKNKDLGKDLFPSSFIAMLEKPNNYMGPYELFGTNNEDAKLPLTRVIERDPSLKRTHLVQVDDLLSGDAKKNTTIPDLYKEDLMSIIKWNGIKISPKKKKPTKKEYNEALENYVGVRIDVGDGWLPRKHDPDHDPENWLKSKGKTLPDSLSLAIDSFLLAVAAKILRGQETDHCSMLIHVTKYTLCQTNVKKIVKEYCDNNFSSILLNDSKTFERLKKIWDFDFVLTSQEMQSNKQFKGIVHNWKDIKPSIKLAVQKLQNIRNEANVVAIHGDSLDELSYFDEPFDKEGFNVIAIGGDKLSRGLTLEGLIVSYFLRPTNMYDTLMQMGRWFGYRDGYADLCRIYSEKELLVNYKHVSHAFEELKEMLKVMKVKGSTPKDFGLRILDSEAMMITSPLKSRYAGTQNLAFSGNSPQTTVFENSINILKSNEKLLNEFIQSLSKNYLNSYEKRDNSHVWNKVKTDELVEFLEKYIGHQAQPNLSKNLIKEYISKQLNRKPKELTEWTVVLYSLKSSKFTNHEKNIGGKKIFPVTRGLIEDNEVTYNIKAISDTKPAVYDFTVAEIQDFVKQNKTFSGDKFNLMGVTKRPPQRGLIVLYPFIPIFDNIKNQSLLHEYQENYKNVEVVVGYRLHFPTSLTAESISYKMNTVMSALGIDENA